MARRAAYLKQSRADTLANLTVEAGNFAAIGIGPADSLKNRTLLDFYRVEGYDAITLSTREIQYGLSTWERAAKEGAPIVVANLYPNSRSRKPLFTPYVIKVEHGHRLGVLGLVSESAWNARRDTTVAAGFQPPLAMGKLIGKLAKKTDHLTVIGDFTAPEADTLAHTFPEIDLIVSSGIKSGERARTVGNTVITGSATRGYFANHIDFAFDPADTIRFRAASQTLDESVPVDSAVQNAVNLVNTSIKNQLLEQQQKPHGSNP